MPIEITSNKGAEEGMGEEAMEETTKTVIKLVDEDQQGKALAIQGRDIPNIKDANIYHNN